MKSIKISAYFPKKSQVGIYFHCIVSLANDAKATEVRQIVVLKWVIEEILYWASSF